MPNLSREEQLLKILLEAGVSKTQLACVMRNIWTTAYLYEKETLCKASILADQFEKVRSL